MKFLKVKYLLFTEDKGLLCSLYPSEIKKNLDSLNLGYVYFHSAALALSLALSIPWSAMRAQKGALASVCPGQVTIFSVLMSNLCSPTDVL